MQPSLIDELDKRYARLGYANRSALFTAFAYALIDRIKTKEDDLVFACAKDLKGTMPFMTEHQIETHLSDLIETMLKPVVAMKGVDAACAAGAGDIQKEYYARYRILLTEEEIKSAFRRYDLMNKNSLREYRTCQMMKHYENEPGTAPTRQEIPNAESRLSKDITQPAENILHPDPPAEKIQTPAEEKQTPKQLKFPAPSIETNGELPHEMH